VTVLVTATTIVMVSLKTKYYIFLSYWMDHCQSHLKDSISNGDTVYLQGVFSGTADWDANLWVMDSIPSQVYVK
jgi:hypothetical protein